VQVPGKQLLANVRGSLLDSTSALMCLLLFKYEIRDSLGWSVTQKGVAKGSVALTSADTRENSLFLILRLRLLHTLTKMQIILNDRRAFSGGESPMYSFFL